MGVGGTMRTIYFKATGLNQFKDNTLEIDFRTTKRVRSDIHIDELDYVSDGIYLPNTMPFVGKNASGKTSTLDCYTRLVSLLTANAVNSLQSATHTGIVEIIYIDLKSNEKKLFKTMLELKANPSGGTSLVSEKIYTRKLMKTDTRKTIVKFEDKNLVYNSEENEFFDVGSVYTNSYLAKQNLNFAAIYSPVHTSTFSVQDEFKNLMKFHYQLGVDNTITLSSILSLLDESIEYLKYSGNGGEYLFKRKSQSEIVITIDVLASILSAGTLRATYIYYYAFVVLGGGNQLIIDEIDLSIHNALAVELINIFQDRKMNPNGATLIFTTHNLNLLDCFTRNDIIHIISNKDGIHNYLLSDVVERNDNNLSKAKQYLQNVVDSSPSYELKMKMRKQFAK